MAAVFLLSYFILILFMLFKKGFKAPLFRLFAIGFAVQFGWEFALLINGIRPMNEASIRNLLINSLIETNLGMPLIYLIFLTWRKRRNEDMTRVLSKEPSEVSCS